MKKKCYYCKKPFKLEKEINDLTDKNKSNFKEFTGIDVSRIKSLHKYLIALINIFLVIL